MNTDQVNVMHLDRIRLESRLKILSLFKLDEVVHCHHAYLASGVLSSLVFVR